MATPRIVVIATAGTIESIGKDRLDLAWYPDVAQRLGEGDLLAGIPELGQLADIHALSYKQPGREADTRDWLGLLALIHGAARDGADGIVITSATNPLEEIAYFVHLAAKTDVPIVFTGAMRPSSALGADGPLNVVNAVRVASAAIAADMGVLVVMNDTILCARDATKTATHRLQAFAAPDYGPIGYADADAVVFMHKPIRPHTYSTEFDVSRLEDLPRVDVVVTYVGSDGALIDAAVAAGAQGIVSAGSGAGWATRGEDIACDRARSLGVIVCQASRTGSGRTTLSPWLRRRDIVAAGDLQPWKARILLALALTITRDVREVQRIFDTY